METLRQVNPRRPGQFPGHDLSRPILEVNRVTVRFGQTLALDDISFQLQQGERMAIIGPNGAGKSTLFKLIAGVLTPDRGRVEIYGHEPGQHICIGYVPQRSQVDWQFPVNVADVVMMGRVGRLGLFRWPGRRDWERVAEALDLVGIADLARRQIGELSGGQQQRVFIARALAQEAELMVMDEPLTGLDIKSQDDIFTILDKLRQRKVTIMVATHDLNLAAERFDRIMLLNQQLIGLGRAGEVFTHELLNRAYHGQIRLIQTHNGSMVISDTCCGDGEDNHDLPGN
jgi:ABC-type Mn2+/Zn2+ transport system ATPase subunit